MSLVSIPILLRLAGGAAFALTIYSSGGFMVPFLLALDRVRIAAGPDEVSLRGLDPEPMAWAGVGLCAVPVVAEALGWVVALLATLGALVVWFGFRVEVRVDAHGTRVVRRALYVVPWRIQRAIDPARAFADGWGDFVDPEALYVSWNNGASKLDLGWAGRGTKVGCDEVARRFNDAVAAASRLE